MENRDKINISLLEVSPKIPQLLQLGSSISSKNQKYQIIEITQRVTPCISAQ